MRYGYTGKIIEVDLTSKEYKLRTIPDEDYRNYLGGSGLAGKLLYSEFDQTKPALSEENPLIFMAGLLTGTRATAAAKLSVVAKSPLTGIWAESTVGGFFGAELKKAGYDGIIIKVSLNPLLPMLMMSRWSSGMLGIVGKDVYDTSEALRQQTDKS